MARVLILSSQVAFGHVGLSAAVPALQALGHRVTAMPTVLLSNHPGWPQAAAQPVAPERIGAMLDALEANGWLPDHDAVLTGYLPSAEHVEAACAAIARLRRAVPGLRVVVDPILGDDPKGLYLAQPAAAAVRDRLLPLADIATPNRFELGWLTGRPVATLTQARDAAAALAGAGGRVLLTSPPLGAGQTGVLAVDPGSARLYRTEQLSGVPHGVGDVFSGLIAAGLPPGAALGHLQALIRASTGAPHLRIVETRAEWITATTLPGTALPDQ